MSLKHTRFCDQCGAEIPKTANYLTTDGISLHSEFGKHRDGRLMVKGGEYCKSACLLADLDKTVEHAS